MSKPYQVYLADMSYFSGKLHAYLRYKQLPCDFHDLTMKSGNLIARKTGVKQVPAIELSNGQWLRDTTPTIEWLDRQHDGASVYPQSASQRFLALLIEDYADEWLWRPAMWWRWIPKRSALQVGDQIGSLMSKSFARPLGKLFAWRQRKEWLFDDGMTEDNSNTIKQMYLVELDFLESVFAKQPFLLGDRPSIADYGYFGSMFRHFGCDPDPKEIMQQRAPYTYQWLERMWATTQSDNDSMLSVGDSPQWQLLFDRIKSDYVPYLQANASAYLTKQPRFDFDGKTISLSRLKTFNYRASCYRVLSERYQALNDVEKQQVNDIVEVDSLLNWPTEKLAHLPGEVPLPIDPLSHGKISLSQLLKGEPRN